MGRRGSARRVSVILLATVGAAVGMGACGGTDSNEEAATTTSPNVAGEAPAPTAAQPGTSTVRARLTGEAEIPGPGDGAGTGSTSLTIDPGRGEVCYQLTVTNIAPAERAHVHRGPGDQTGPVVVELTAPVNGASDGCVSVDQALAREILAGPGGFYVNVHNRPFPAGALRGQLAA